MGQVLRYLHRYEEALDAYDHAVNIQPNYAWAINGKGIVLEQMGRYEEALACYLKAADRRMDVWHWYNHGNVLVLLGRFDEALPALEKAIEVVARSCPQLGAAGQRPAPVEALRRGAGRLRARHPMEPDYAWAWNEQGIALEVLGQFDEALQAYRHASEAAPDEPCTSSGRRTS